MRYLELLSPARDKRIGIAAIDCGADAVYIAGPAFGARAAAGNSVEDIAELCRYASAIGARIFVTLNTIIYEN
jgi:putative protease